MKKKKNVKGFILLIVELVLVVGIVAGIYFWTSSKNETVKVLAYTANINAGTNAHQITAEDVTSSVVLKSSVTEDMVLETQKSVLVGRYLTADVSKGQYVTLSNIYKELGVNVDDIVKANPDLTSKITIPVDYETAVSGNIKAGDIVDLVHCGTATDDKDGDFTFAYMFLNNVLVYSVNTDDAFVYADHSNMSQGEDAGGSIGLLTVAVTREQALEITARMKTGQVSVVGQFSEDGLTSAVPGTYNIYGDNSTKVNDFDGKSGTVVKPSKESETKDTSADTSSKETTPAEDKKSEK